MIWALPENAILMAKKNPRPHSMSGPPHGVAAETAIFSELGNPNARLIFIQGASPEDPEAGALLSKMIQAMGLHEPEDTLILHFQGNLCREQILRHSGDILILLGEELAPFFADENIVPANGVFFKWENRNILWTFHPRHLLQVPAAKKLAWDDLKKVCALLGVTPKPAKG